MASDSCDSQRFVERARIAVVDSKQIRSVDFNDATRCSIFSNIKRGASYDDGVLACRFSRFENPLGFSRSLRSDLSLRSKRAIDIGIGILREKANVTRPDRASWREIK